MSSQCLHGMSLQESSLNTGGATLKLFIIHLNLNNMKSTFLGLNWKDFLKGGIVAFIVAVLTGALQLFQTGPVEWTWLFWQPTIYAGITALIAYLLKNLVTNSNDEILKGESK
jgi:hypothetical protein